MTLVELICACVARSAEKKTSACKARSFVVKAMVRVNRDVAKTLPQLSERVYCSEHYARSLLTARYHSIRATAQKLLVIKAKQVYSSSNGPRLLRAQIRS